MKKVYYLGYYDIIENKEEKRNYVLSASNKMSYIIEALENAGYDVEVISASHTGNNRFYRGKLVSIGKNSKLRLFDTTPWGNKICRVISILSMRYQYYKYILNNLTANDILIVYHSVDYADLIAKAKRKKGFRLVLEVEEIYSDVNGDNKDREKERNIFGLADAYIFPTIMLDCKLNLESKPSIISHGTYKTDPKITEKFNDKKIHVVYAGTFDPRKGGAFAAVKTATMLDDNYHIHILGFGNIIDKQNLLDEIECTNRISQCKVSFEGLLSGKEYIEFLQSCHVGLSTQNPNGVYNDTSFPSKILSYMANGLRVVSVRLPVIETSSIDKYMYYYDEQTPKEIAKAIKAVDFSKTYDSRNVLSQLDKQFVQDVCKMLGE